MAISRRKFIQLSSLASASLMIPNFLKGFEYKQNRVTGNKTLVVLQLSGGNDGLNTIIPYRNDIYYKFRPAIGITKTKALPLTDDIGIHPSLKGIRELYDNGNLSIINGVGYPNPNRSHFRSMDIWQSASKADELIATGWLGRYLDHACPDCNTHNALAIEVDDTLSLAMKGDLKNAIAVRDIDRFHNAATSGFFREISTHEQEHKERLCSYLYQTLSETVSAADYVYEQSKIYKTSQNYPDTQLGKQLKTIGSLIISKAETKVYYLSLGGFDTHVNQNERQEKLLEQLDLALTAFINDLKQNECLEDVLVMTFSEFGRRVAQNASNGTDHGTAGNMILISGALKKPGIYNPIPSLEDLDEGDLKYAIDFKQVYATLLDNWLQTDSKSILGRRYETLGFV